MEKYTSHCQHKMHFLFTATDTIMLFMNVCTYLFTFNRKAKNSSIFCQVPFILMPVLVVLLLLPLLLFYCCSCCLYCSCCLSATAIAVVVDTKPVSENAQRAVPFTKCQKQSQSYCQHDLSQHTVT